MVKDVAKYKTYIYETLHNHQVDYQLEIVKVQGKIVKQYLSIFIDPSSNHTYVSPKIFEYCYLLMRGKIPRNKGGHWPFCKSQLDLRTFGMAGLMGLWTHYHLSVI